MITHTHIRSSGVGNGNVMYFNCKLERGICAYFFPLALVLLLSSCHEKVGPRKSHQMTNFSFQKEVLGGNIII